MKKGFTIAAVALLVFSALALVACGSSKGEAPTADSPYVGVWHPVKAEFQGKEVGIDEALNGATYIIELKADGTAILTEEKESTGTWTVTDKGVHIEAGDTKTDFPADENGNITLDFLGFVITFEKQ